jgi:hypothetical protein
LQDKVDKRLDSLNYKRIQVISFGDTPAEDINSRRYRISEIHNKAKHYVSDDCEYVFLYEDDTVIPKGTLTQLFKSFKSVDNCGFMQGVQVGRHNTPYIGAWLYTPDEFISLLPNIGVEEITAGGFYCALVDADLYKNHHFEPFDKEGLNGLSCDVNFGMYVRQQGYGCWIDWDVQTDHIGERGSVNIGNTTPVQLQFKKGEDDKWTCVRV